jgi:hypothetical protein
MPSRADDLQAHTALVLGNLLPDLADTDCVHDVLTIV